MIQQIVEPASLENGGESDIQEVRLDHPDNGEAAQDIEEDKPV